MNDGTIKITGPKILKLADTEIAIVLDALAAQPFGRVVGVFNNIVAQAADKPEVPLTQQQFQEMIREAAKE